MKKLAIIITLLCSVMVGNSQTQQVKGSISIKDTADLFVYNTYPDSFPTISVIFKAETRSGKPLWGLKSDKVEVSEDNSACPIVSLKQISIDKQINIGIVIDHSGSMLFDSTQLTHEEWVRTQRIYDTGGIPVFHDGYVPPIESAKQAIKGFIKSFDNKKDLISLVAFSDTIDKAIGLTNDTMEIDTTINSIKANNGTKLYDAMLLGLQQLKNAGGIKALVVLTDGEDNLSDNNYNAVIDMANQFNIPIYAVGLGDANKDTLRMIAKSTNGYFYYTHSASALAGIYNQISGSLQAFYDIVYESHNLSETDTSRQIQISFDIDTLAFYTNAYQMKIPAEVLSYAANHSNTVRSNTHTTMVALNKPASIATDYDTASSAKEDTLTQEENVPLTKNVPDEVSKYIAGKPEEKNYALEGIIVVAVVVSAGVLLFKAKKPNLERPANTNQPVLLNIYPNPTKGITNVSFSGTPGTLVIMNLMGQQVKNIDASNNIMQTDLSDLPDGNYIAIILSGGTQSNPMKFIVSK